MATKDKTKLKAQIKRKFKVVMALANFNDLLELDDTLSDWSSNLRERR